MARAPLAAVDISRRHQPSCRRFGILSPVRVAVMSLIALQERSRGARSRALHFTRKREREP